MLISYETYDTFPGWAGAAALFASLIDTHGGSEILEIGAGANPTLPVTHVTANELRYTTNDVSADELAKAGDGYETLCADMATADPSSLPQGAYDFVFSRMVNEHVADGRAYYENIFRVLIPGGVSAHCFATLYAAPFLLNRLLPEAAAGRLLDAVAPRDRYQRDKFRAHYSWSRGPSPRMIARLQAIGFEVLNYDGFFGHAYYDRPSLRVLHRLERAKAAWLRDHPVAALTSYAVVVLRKPDGAGSVGSARG